MKARKTIVVLGCAWDGARFFILLSISLWLYMAASGWGTSIGAWLLAASAAGLLLPTGELFFCLYPGRYGNLLNLLILGKILNIVSLLLLFFSGALSTGIGAVLFQAGPLPVTQAFACSLIAVFDLLSLVALGAAGGQLAEGGKQPPKAEPALPPFTEEEIKEYH